MEDYMNEILATLTEDEILTPEQVAEYEAMRYDPEDEDCPDFWNDAY